MPSRAFFSTPAHVTGYPVSTASGAGERSSVFVSPVTLKMVTVIFRQRRRLRNHSASPVIASPVWHIRCPFAFYVVEARTSAGCETARFGSNRRQFRIVQRINQRMNVATTPHGAQQFNGFSGSIMGVWCRSRQQRENRVFNISGFIYASERG